MYVGQRRHWTVVVRSLSVLILTAALLSFAGLSGASASGPAGGARVSGAMGLFPGSGGNGNGSGGTPTPPPMPSGPTKPSAPPVPSGEHMHGMGEHGECHCFYPMFQPSFFPIAVPVYQPLIAAPTYGFAAGYVPPVSYAAPVTYAAPATYTATPALQSVTTQSFAAYTPDMIATLSPAALQQVCHQYSVALQYNTQPDNPGLDQACGTTPGSTSGTSSTTTVPATYPANSYP